MKPILPSNPATISERQWDLSTQEGCEARLAHLRKMDTHERRITAAREREKESIQRTLDQLAGARKSVERE